MQTRHLSALGRISEIDRGFNGLRLSTRLDWCPAHWTHEGGVDWAMGVDLTSAITAT